MPLVTATCDTSCIFRPKRSVRRKSQPGTPPMTRLQAFDVSTPIKLSAAWAATVLCYIYCDYFDLYVPGKVQSMIDGEGPFGPVSQLTLLGAGVLLLVPSTMVFLSVALRPAASHLLNLIFGVIYTLIMVLLALVVQWYFYKLFAVVEAALTATIVWIAWRWPKVDAG